MSYRTIKRAFGETNLERKCRVLFGVCLGLLIFGAFLWVDRIGEKLVKQNTDQIGRDWAKMALFHLHWMRWETSEETETFLQEMTSDLLTENYEWTILSLGRDDVAWQCLPNAKTPESAEESRKLQELKARWEEKGADALPAPEPRLRREAEIAKELSHGRYGGNSPDFLRRVRRAARGARGWTSRNERRHCRSGNS